MRLERVAFKGRAASAYFLFEVVVLEGRRI
jgi:hypothetical protein